MRDKGMSGKKCFYKIKGMLGLKAMGGVRGMSQRVIVVGFMAVAVSAMAVPPVVHPEVGVTASFGGDKEVKLTGKLHYYPQGPSAGRDADILSPKSVNIHPSGRKFYVNSLEGGTTLVYSLPEMEKLAVIKHRFTSADSALWTPPSGLFRFRHYTKNLGTFMGKPVESAFSHGGRYLWVPYYRRSFDLNAQDPSAIAIIDTEADSIVRMMEAGVLPKMVALSPDGNTIAIAHWGDNTVGLIDVSSSRPDEWKYKANVAVGRQLFHDFSLTEPVNRDSNTGEALRGTVFTPDSRFLLVGCMSGGGIAVIDVEKQKYLGKLVGMMSNIRHLVIRNGYLYATVNIAGYVERIPLAKVVDAVESMDGSGNVTLTGWENCKVGSGARTMELSPKGDYIFVACNFDSRLCIVDSTMTLVAEIEADSYPVGLDVSPDGKWLITTSQGRAEAIGAGNCVDIFSLSGLDSDFQYVEPGVDTADAAVATDSVAAPLNQPQQPESGRNGFITIIIAAIAVIAVAAITIVLLRRRKK